MAVKHCSKCGEDNSEDSVSCVICGTSLKGAELLGVKNNEKQSEFFNPEGKEMRNKKIKLNEILVNGANWFYLIGVLSLINALLSLSNKNIRFIFGLISTDFFILLSKLTKLQNIKLTFYVITFILCAFFIIIGYLGNKQKKWCFIVGGILYSADTVLLLLFKNYHDIFWHIIAIYAIFKGFTAINKIKNVDTVIQRLE